MLTDIPLTAVIPATDIDRAKRFYRDVVGCKLVSDMRQTALFQSGGTVFTIYATPSGGQAAHTLAGWAVTDLNAEMEVLRARGVTFEEYDLPGLVTVDGVAEAGGVRSAWFKDSEGNILTLVESASG